MINNNNKILLQNIGDAEKILVEFMNKIMKQEADGNLTIDSIEPLIGDAIKSFSKTILDMSGTALSNITNDVNNTKKKL